MPFYEYSCEACGTIENEFHPTIPNKIVKPKCPKCSQEMERDYHREFTGHKPGSVFPFIHTHLTGDGSPILITSERHYQHVCREQSLKRYGIPDAIVPRPDAAFIDDRVETNARGERVEIPGTGAGHPRSWANIPALLKESKEDIIAFLDRNKDRKYEAK
jgi:putative FmdB family regulatory protein